MAKNDVRHSTPMDSAQHSGRRLAPQSAATDERRLRLVESAYLLIVEKGMAGLSIREVASRIGLNHATLLYYFPTKETLIQAVVAHCIRQFEEIRAPHIADVVPPATPGAFLHQRYLADMAYQLREIPDLFLVLDELLLYARRDPATRRVLTEAVTYWLASLENLIQQEIDAHHFRADLDARSAALTLMSFCQGIGLLLQTRPEDIDGILAQFAAWFHTLSPPQTSKHM